MSRSTSSAAEAPRPRRPNSYCTIATPPSPIPGAAASPAKRALLIGSTDGGRILTLGIERTVDPTSWLIVTGWSSTQTERKMLDS